jgi:hypothetical protein
MHFPQALVILRSFDKFMDHPQAQIILSLTSGTGLSTDIIHIDKLVLFKKYITHNCHIYICTHTYIYVYTPIAIHTT